jgi:hypothetical protein
VQNDQLMAEGDDSKEPFQMIANLDLQTLNISVKARLDVAKLNLMLLTVHKSVPAVRIHLAPPTRTSLALLDGARGRL